jgi:hypothetical protein
MGEGSETGETGETRIEDRGQRKVVSGSKFQVQGSKLE